ncbi:hypothetical protein BGZ63DRAFT_403497 [Mariannaea sp. PMI_226]|nr:hypothetical protein BGZ63DRAFT_403497 [Mariannaea sp. PMI_226]
MGSTPKRRSGQQWASSLVAMCRQEGTATKLPFPPTPSIRGLVIVQLTAHPSAACLRLPQLSASNLKLIWSLDLAPNDDMPCPGQWPPLAMHNFAVPFTHPRFNVVQSTAWQASAQCDFFWYKVQASSRPLAWERMLQDPKGRLKVGGLKAQHFCSISDFGFLQLFGTASPFDSAALVNRGSLGNDLMGRGPFLASREVGCRQNPPIGFKAPTEPGLIYAPGGKVQPAILPLSLPFQKPLRSLRALIAIGELNNRVAVNPLMKRNYDAGPLPIIRFMHYHSYSS